MNNEYKGQVQLLLRILPIVISEECFAIHGGTAINLFVANLLRLSVDIDLTYIPLENRDSSLTHINEALIRIADKLRKQLRINITPLLDRCKLMCKWQNWEVKIEVNPLRQL